MLKVILSSVGVVKYLHVMKVIKHLIILSFYLFSFSAYVIKLTVLIMLAAEVPRTEAINNGSKLKRSIMGKSNGKCCMNLPFR